MPSGSEEAIEQCSDLRQQLAVMTEREEIWECVDDDDVAGRVLKAGAQGRPLAPVLLMHDPPLSPLIGMSGNLFQFYVNKEKKDEITGANKENLVKSIKKNILNTI